MILGALAFGFSAVPVLSQTSRKAIANPQPEFPEIAKRMHLSGVVKVTILVGTDGQIKNMEFQGGHPLLIDSVQTALKKWKYAPANSETEFNLEFKF